MEIFAKCLENCPSVVSLNLQGNSLGEASADKIGLAFQNSETIKYLNLENNKIGTNGIIVIGT
jgi:Ran GTPase-activating protein (RanGAP) involved in mRNA processing and transport